MRKLTLIAVTVMMVGAVSATVGFTKTSEIPEEFSGGESFQIDTTFQNTENRSLPVFFVLNVTNSTGHEVDPAAFRLEFVDSEVSEGCELDRFFGDYVCTFRNVSPGEYDASFKASSHPALRPGNYSISLDVLSAAGIDPNKVIQGELPAPDEWNATRRGFFSSFSDGDAEVWVRPSNTTNDLEAQSYVLVEELGNVTPETPDDEEFVQAVQVEVMETPPFENPDRKSVWIKSLFFGGEAEVDSEGNVTIEFSDSEVNGLNPATLSIHRYDRSSGEWEELETDVDGNSASAEVEEFSVFALFGEELIPDTGDGDGDGTVPGGGGSINISGEVDLPDNASDIAENVTDDVTPGPPENTPGEGNQGEQGEAGETGEEQSSGEQGQQEDQGLPGPTGLFAGGIPDIFQSIIDALVDLLPF